MTVRVCTASDMHPFNCDGPEGDCIHCNRAVDVYHYPRECALCDPEYDLRPAYRGPRRRRCRRCFKYLTTRQWPDHECTEFFLKRETLHRWHCFWLTLDHGEPLPGADGKSVEYIRHVGSAEGIQEGCSRCGTDRTYGG